jgi:pseudouridine synthase
MGMGFPHQKVLVTAMKERLQKIMSRAGIASRRAAEKLILEGRVSVDGRVVTELGTKADPESSEIRVNGRRIRMGRKRRYLVLNKPRGFVTTRSDPSNRPTVMELLPPTLRSLFPVGRLDMGTTGLLLLTDDGDFAQRIAHPSYEVEKTYMLTVRGVPNERALEKARKGMQVDGQKLAVKNVELLRAHRKGPPRKKAVVAGEPKEKARLRVVLVEGKNREVRRLFRALGHPVLELHRSRIGPLSDRGLPPGAYRSLTPREIHRFAPLRAVRRVRRIRKSGRLRKSGGRG